MSHAGACTREDQLEVFIFITSIAFTCNIFGSSFQGPVYLPGKDIFSL
jgi:hypothetical protein